MLNEYMLHQCITSSWT